SAGPEPPKAPKHPMVDTYWGEKVTDDYQYMENVSDPPVAKWVKGQNAYTRAWLDGHPERKAILDRIVALTHSESPRYYSVTYQNGLYFFMKDQPPKQQPSLVVLTSVSDVASERPVADLPFYLQIYFHKLGTQVSADPYVLGKEFPKIAEIQLSTSPDGRSILADVFNGDGGEHSYWLLAPGAAWTQVTRFEDGIVQGKFGMDDALYLLSRAGAPRRKILRLPLSTPTLSAAKVLVPETENAIEGYTPTASRLYVTEMIGGPTQNRVYD